MKRRKEKLFVVLSFVGYCAFAQQTTIVTIDHMVQRYLDNVSKLERNIYFNMHSTPGNDKDISKFVNDYNVGFGRGFWGPFSWSYNKTKEAGKYPIPTHDYDTSSRPTQRYISTEHANNQIVKYGMDTEKAGAWAAEYFSNKNCSGSVIPEFFEPMNEPFVHAGDECFKPATSEQMKTLIISYYAQIGKHIHQSPRLQKMKVVGYADAYPSMEINDFSHWNGNMKKFIDGAGEHMDAISVHLYDGINIRGKKSRRSGSNSEAILDLVETYCYKQFGFVKPHAITEYGGIDDTETPEYSEIVNARSVASINHLLFNLLERQDKLLISVPFLVDKAEWYINAANNYQSYGPALFLPDNPNDLKNTTWRLSKKADFFKLWKDVEGDRIEAQTSNPDIQVSAFRNGNKLYVAIDNVDDFPHFINLQNISGWESVSNVKLRSLKVFYDTGIEYEETEFAPESDKLKIEKDETVILVADVSSEAYKNAIRRKKYYTSTYLQPIRSGVPITFSFGGVDVGYGRAIARMSIGRKHSMSKKPEVKVNGISVDVPDNWKGYDQVGRDDFFGMLEIPFDLALLKESDNEITFIFPDAGGHVSSVVLQAERYDKKPLLYSKDFVNKDFEIGKLNGWIPWCIEGNIKLDSEAANGEYAAKISGPAGLSQMLSIDENSNYVFSFFTKKKGEGVAVIGADIQGVDFEEINNTSYMEHEFEFNSGNNSVVRLFIDVKDFATSVWIDDVKLEKK
ncbi:beta-porphyranase A [Bacteroides xylanisolvens]|uniref:beta-porphyranase A n=1 Tax=Bacteroides xylanisolvens TaxID=371601 RepID=UPI001CDBA8B7|nr:beta-porphyranase A [Bacteroides xylanisolvens]MCA4599121.1 beta-porphyranase A [Bacteroides xylanisolvens]MCA4613092.1 beta-porphyranase A [Bacteroides xylanisolvens]MCA4640347.1 beta-porphyranase A [Bacteroides xylanisolvens]MCA4645102.1 beta-porphyranase A [Bacteroides xylanisolvens]MCA4650047.1 beta-porphyranase A [Bacteroides xylanisolvens]